MLNGVYRFPAMESVVFGTPYTEALAQEVADQGILVNAVVPSIMDTPANRGAMPTANYDDWPKVEEVVATILFLASPENKVTRGAVVSAYGRS